MPNTQTQTTSTTIDPRVAGRWEGLYNWGNYLAARPYQAPPSAVAGWNPMQGQAYNFLSQAFGGGAPSGMVNPMGGAPSMAGGPTNPLLGSGRSIDDLSDDEIMGLHALNPANGITQENGQYFQTDRSGSRAPIDIRNFNRRDTELMLSGAMTPEQMRGTYDPSVMAGAGQAGGAAGGTGIGEAQDAASVARRIAAGGASPMVRPMMLSAPNAAYAGDVNAGNPLDMMGGYRNAFEDQVVGTALSDLDRSRQITQQQNASNATMSGAFGGDRHAIVEAETNRGFADAAARTAAQLRSQGFTTAADLAQMDAGRGLQAGMANQGARNSMSQFNAGLGFNAGQANQSAGLNADLANQNAWFTGRDQQLQGAGLLSGFGGDIFNRTVGTADAMYNMGARAQAQDQRYLDERLNNFYDERDYGWGQLNNLAGIAGGMPYGQTTTSTMTMPRNRGAGVAGGAMAGAGIGSAFGPWGAGIGAVGGGLLGFFGS